MTSRLMAFTTTAGEVHNVKNASRSAPAKALAFYVEKKGTKLEDLLVSSEITLWAVRQESRWRDRCACFARWLGIARVLDVNRDLAHLRVNTL
jgi:hypothetical protein